MYPFSILKSHVEYRQIQLPVEGGQLIILILIYYYKGRGVYAIRIIKCG